MLQGNELDIAFVSYPASAEPLRTELTFKEELALFAPTNGDDKFDPKRWRTNSDLPLIVQRQACSYSELFLSYLTNHDLRVPRTIEAGSIAALLGRSNKALGLRLRHVV